MSTRQVRRIFKALLLSLICLPGIWVKEVPAQQQPCPHHFASPHRHFGEWESILTFGPEFTFSDKRMFYTERLGAKGSAPDHLPYRTRKHAEIRRLLEDRCATRGDCRIETGSDKHGGNFRVTYSDGWYFEVGVDDGVLEAQTKPGTLIEFRKQGERIQRDLFDAMEKIGLRPRSDGGGGHIHMGALPFRKDPVLFRNFFVDYANHPDVCGMFSGYEYASSPPLASLGKKQRMGFVGALAEFDAIEEPQLKDFIWRIHRDVYTQPGPQTALQIWGRESGAGSYYQAIRLARMSWPEHLATAEIRAFAAQKSFEEYLLQMELLTARVRFLAEKGERVPFRQVNWKESRKPQVIVDQFFSYVTETGLPWERYRVLLPEKLQAIRPSGLR